MSAVGVYKYPYITILSGVCRMTEKRGMIWALSLLLALSCPVDSEIRYWQPSNVSVDWLFAGGTNLSLEGNTSFYDPNITDLWANASGQLNDVASVSPYISVSGRRVINFSEALLNSTITDHLTTITYNASNVNVTAGNFVSGVTFNVWKEKDGLYYNVTEAAGASPLAIEVNFSSMGNKTFDRINYRIMYSGGAGHQIDVQLLSISTLEWETYSVINSGDYSEASILIPDYQDHISAAGIVKVRLFHPGTGINGHLLSIDMIQLAKGISFTGGTLHDDLGGRNLPTNHPLMQAVLDAITAPKQCAGGFVNWTNGTSILCGTPEDAPIPADYYGNISALQANVTDLWTNASDQQDSIRQNGLDHNTINQGLLNQGLSIMNLEKNKSCGGNGFVNWTNGTDIGCGIVSASGGSFNPMWVEAPWITPNSSIMGGQINGTNLTLSNSLMMGSRGMSGCSPVGFTVEPRICFEDASIPYLTLISHDPNANNAPYIYYLHNLNSSYGLVPSAVNDRLGAFIYMGVNSGRNPANSAAFGAEADGAAGASRVPTRFFFQTYTGTSNNYFQWIMDSAGTLRPNSNKLQNFGTASLSADNCYCDDFVNTPRDVISLTENNNGVEISSGTEEDTIKIIKDANSYPNYLEVLKAIPYNESTGLTDENNIPVMLRDDESNKDTLSTYALMMAMRQTILEQNERIKALEAKIN